MVLQDEFCNKCGEKYTIVNYKWCKPCQIDNLKGNFTTSGNETIDNFIQEMQLKIDKYNDIVFEWIPYNQFSDIKEMRFATDRKSTRLNSSHSQISYAVFCLKKKKKITENYHK